MRRDPEVARTLGLWTAAWLAVLLVAGLIWLGDLSLQWPVLLVPAIWALVALRRGRGIRADDDEGGSFWDVPDERPRRPVQHRTDTVERPAVRHDREGGFSRRRREPWG